MLLVDADALAKLSHWNLLDDVEVATGRRWSDASTFSSLRVRAVKAVDRPDGKLFRSSEAAQRASRVLEQMRPLPLVQDSLIAWAERATGIDPGEAQLFSVAMNSDALVLTGDKRALRTVSALSEAVWRPLCGKVMIVEQVVSVALQQRGLFDLRARICPDREIDRAIAFVMGSNCDASEDSVSEGLRSYVSEIRNLTDPSLLRID